ncbi:hypothetical protein F4808DRAFT_60343 [Astrocystis sublimbata]|nr:hypothetical protein F4808DRAFT_60343 [Astrocystis sublimbata]
MQADSSLFSLPGEVRDRIYDFYLTFDHGDFGDTLRPHQVYLDDATYSRPLPALMCTCKRIYQDMAPIVHAQAAMRIEIRGRVDRRIGFAVRGKLRFERLRKLWLLVHLEHPNWNSWLYFFGDVVRRSPNLEVLIMDWVPRPVAQNGWSGRVDAKKEDEFFQTIRELKALHTLIVYGDISARWTEVLQTANLRIIHRRYRWWREPGDA